MTEDKDYTLGWIIYLSMVVFMIVTGLGLDYWYTKNQEEKGGEEYLQA